MLQKVLVDDKKTIFHKNVYKSKISPGKCRSSRQNKLKSSFSGRQTFRRRVFNDQGVMWICNVSNGSAALVLSAVVICRMIVKMLFDFIFSETSSDKCCK